MHEDGKKLLSLMFRPDETICVSPNQFGYHAVPLKTALDGPVPLVPTPESLEKRNLTFEQGIERMESERLTLVALNPIKGYREDANCYAYRNFLVELDFGLLAQQKGYVDQMGMPYSAVIFSGNKSLHFLISLDQDLPSENVYRHFSDWIRHIMTLADQNTINPSRSIRIPGAWREPKKQQRLVDFKGPVKLSDLVAWCNLHPDAKPKQKEKRECLESFNFDKLKPWVKDRLKKGLDPSKGRNKQWFSIACEFALAGYEEDATIDILRDFFSPERDFKEKEWLLAISQGFKYIYDRD